MAPISQADQAISVLRDGIRAVSDLVGLPHPSWAADDADPGWQGRRGGIGISSEMYSIRAGAREDDPECIRITYILRGQEHLTEIAPPSTPPGPMLDKLLTSLNIPVEAVRAYRGKNLLEERITNMRT